MGAQASGDVEPVRWHALTTDRDGAPQRVKGVRGNPPLAGTYADLCACCCSREKIHHCTVCKETRPAFLMAMGPSRQVATKGVRCAREQGQGGVARFSVENNALLDDIQGTPFDGATEAEV